MFDISKRRFVFRQDTGRLWSIFHDENEGICFSRYSKLAGWEPPMRIRKSVHHSFFAELLDDNTIHMVYQDSMGYLYYSKISSNNIETACILKSSAESFYNKHLCLFGLGGITNVLFTIRDGTKRLLSSQMFHEETIMDPTAIDYIIPGVRPYKLQAGFDGTRFIFYQSASDNRFRIGVREYSSEQRGWNEFKSLYIGKPDVEFVDALLDSSDNAHIITQKYDDNGFELYYTKTNIKINAAPEPYLLSSSGSSFDNCSIVKKKNVLIIYYIVEEEIYFCRSYDDGLQWSQPARYRFGSDEDCFCIHYRSNLENDFAKNGFDYPARLSNGITLAFGEMNGDSSTQVIQLEKRHIELQHEIEELRKEINNIKKTPPY